jgi:hypothetical protein
VNEFIDLDSSSYIIFGRGQPAKRIMEMFFTKLATISGGGHLRLLARTQRAVSDDGTQAALLAPA